MKPDWKDAPEWAECLIRNNDGEWWWLENKPIHFLNYDGDIEWECQGKTERTGDSFVRYHPSIEMRPDHIPVGNMIKEKNA